MPQDALNGMEIGAGLQHQCGSGVPQIVEAQLSTNGRLPQFEIAAGAVLVVRGFGLDREATALSAALQLVMLDDARLGQGAAQHALGREAAAAAHPALAVGEHVECVFRPS